jgi:N-acetylglutamate synthase-like GNAT family acetyltransferase
MEKMNFEKITKMLSTAYWSQGIEKDEVVRGAGKLMVEHILRHDEMKRVCQWFLITQNAHALYGKFGFAPLSKPDEMMELRRPGPQKQAAVFQ